MRWKEKEEDFQCEKVTAGFEEGERGTRGKAYSSLTKLASPPLSAARTQGLWSYSFKKRNTANNPGAQETDSAPGPPKRSATCPPLEFCPVRLTPDF